MDKRKEENIRVRRSIVSSLFSLMAERPLVHITVTDIIQKANVARASFYRNFSSKEDVLIYWIRYVLEDFRSNATYDLEDYTSLQNVRRAFDYFYRYKQYVLNLYHAGLGPLLLEELNQFHESIAGIMSARSPKRFQMYAFIGALYNTAIVWLLGDSKEQPDDLAHALLEKPS